MSTFQRRLEELRTEKGLDTAAAADRVGISAQQYRDFELGSMHANVTERLGLLVGLGMDVDDARAAAREPDVVDLGNLADLIDADEANMPFARTSDDAIEVLSHGASGLVYKVALNRVGSGEAVMRWIEHLCGKTWITTRHIRQFVRLCADHLGTDIHGVS